MVHKQVQPLLALGLEGLGKAKWLFVCRLVAHCAALGLAITAAVMVESGDTALEIATASGAILCEFLAFWLHHQASDIHSRGREVMRRVMLLDALHPEQAAAALPKLQHHFGKDVERRAAALQAQDQQRPEKDQRLFNYYYSRKPLGQLRLRDHLFESAIFSHHLYAAAWRFSLICLFVLLGLAGTAVAVLVFGTHSEHSMTTLFVRLLIALVAFVPASQELDHLLLYRSVEVQLGELLKRVEALYAEPLDDKQIHAGLLADVGDYCAATTFAPPIRTLVYQVLVRRLAVEFEEKMRALENGSKPTA
jgi:hypothetical protein